MNNFSFQHSNFQNVRQINQIQQEENEDFERQEENDPIEFLKNKIHLEERKMNDLEIKAHEKVKISKELFSPFQKLKSCLYSVGSISESNWMDGFGYEYFCFYLNFENKNQILNDDLSLIFSNLKYEPENWKNNLLFLINDKIVNEGVKQSQEMNNSDSGDSDGGGNLDFKKIDSYFSIQIPKKFLKLKNKISIRIPKWRKGFIHFVNIGENKIENLIEEIEKKSNEKISIKCVEEIFGKFEKFETKFKLKKMIKNEEFEIKNEIVSLIDPYTRLRIKNPCKGIGCEHKQCYDLETFLINFKHSKISKCPICNIRIEIHSILIDYKIKEILNETNENRIILKQDGNFEIIENENEKIEKKENGIVEIINIDEEDSDNDQFNLTDPIIITID
eukprot:gene3480-6129_t